MPPRRSARDRAVDLLREVLERGGRATPLLSKRGAGLPAADQDLLRELVLGVLRWRLALDAEIASVSRVPLPRLAPKLREILEVALYQIRHLDRIPHYAAVSEAVTQARTSGGEGAAKLVNGVLRGILLLPPPSPPRGEGRVEGVELARHFSHPAFLVERWLERFGPERTRGILEADNRPSGLDLMVNPMGGSRETLVEDLHTEGIEARPSALSPLGLTVVSGNPFRSSLFGRGRFAVQDLGSQALPLLLPPGDTLIDLAAAPGGKSFAALSLGQARRAVALDRSLTRLRLFEENRVRLALPQATPVAADLSAAPLAPGRFDRVLFDAPCSGTGTLRKSPEIRYRVTPASIESLAAVQEAGLRAAAELLAPDGFLLYSTCSLEAEENERVVGRVLEKMPRLEAFPIEAPEGLRPYVSGALFRLFPDRETDGFTAHLLRRKPADSPRGVTSTPTPRIDSGRP
jgi:16S rRNA (cytosine967-C5)-methyltransferase